VLPLTEPQLPKESDMQEFRTLAIDTFHESENNPRRVFADAPLQELPTAFENTVSSNR
jgi:hypothetical protein